MGIFKTIHVIIDKVYSLFHDIQPKFQVNFQQSWSRRDRCLLRSQVLKCTKLESYKRIEYR